MDCTIVGEKLSHSPVAMGKAHVLNTLNLVELWECTELGNDVLGIVRNTQKAEYSCKNITVNNSNYIS